jgi:hypothetical protein
MQRAEMSDPVMPLRSALGLLKARGRVVVAAAALTLCLALSVAGCNKSPEPDKTAPTARPEPPAASAPLDPHTGMGPHPGMDPHGGGPTDVAFDAPARWQKAENPSPMRKATYKIPHAPGDTDDAELSVSQAGGTVDMNLQRWAGQFGKTAADVKRTEKKVGDLRVTVAEIHGTFAGSGMPGAPSSGPKDKYAMLAAIVETTPPTFFKLTGSEKTVAAAHAEFDNFIDGLRAK